MEMVLGFAHPLNCVSYKPHDCKILSVHVLSLGVHLHKPSKVPSNSDVFFFLAQVFSLTGPKLLHRRSVQQTRNS